MRIKKTKYFLVVIIAVFNLVESKCQKTLLPIYSNPMVFLDSLGNVVGTLPEGTKILNTTDGKHNKGYIHGLAGNTVSANTLIPAKDFNTGKISFYDKTGRFTLSYGDLFEAISPNKDGFHLAKRIDGKSRMLPKTYYNFLNKNGSRVFNYNGYEKADVFNEGYAAVKHRSRWFYINNQGDRFHLIDSTITNIKDVSSFYDGLSKIKIRKGMCKYKEHFRYILINKKGDVVLDTDDIFPNRFISQMGVMRDSISILSFFDDNCGIHWGEAAYIGIKGNIVAQFDSLERRKSFVDGYVPVIILKKENQRYVKGDGFIMDNDGERISFGDNKKIYELSHIHKQFYWVYIQDSIDSSRISGVFDASKREFVYRNKHNIMGMKWDLISLYDSKNNRYYVVNYKTGETVYDTDISK